MKIVEQSESRLVLEARPVGMMIVCVGLFLTFLVLGFGMRSMAETFAGLAGVAGAEGLGIIPEIPGMTLMAYASVIPLLVAVFLIKTRRVVLDRGTGQVTIASRGALGRREKSLPLASLQAASLASTRSDEGGTTYRCVLHFGGEAGPVPLTPYFTSGTGPGRAVTAINGWLGTQASVVQAQVLHGKEAAEVIAALEKLGIRIPPRQGGAD
jgi:hypothetical protein